MPFSWTAYQPNFCLIIVEACRCGEELQHSMVICSTSIGLKNTISAVQMVSIY
jgi:hypothetical protein